MQLHGVEKYKLFPNHERSAVHHIRFFFLLIIEGALCSVYSVLTLEGRSAFDNPLTVYVG